MVGLVFLYLMVRNREVPLLPIGTVTPMMNFAGVRIAGTVENSPYIKRKGNDVEFLSFYVNDGTGELQITVSKEKARKWVEEKRIPGKGDRVELGGTLNVSSDGKIRLRASRISLDRERSLKKNNSELNQRSEK
jgi:lysyl-tRNA synthetase class II